MTLIYHVAAEAEPRELHGEIDDVSVIGVHLALQSTSDSEGGAQAEIEEALSRIAHGTFHLFKVDGSAAAPVEELTRLYPVPADPSFGWTQVRAWLRRSKQAYYRLDAGLAFDTDIVDVSESFEFYKVPAEGDRLIAQARAVDLLRATAKWPAPLAQDAGLTVPLKTEQPLQESSRFFVVFLPEGLDLASLHFAAPQIDADLATVAFKTDLADPEPAFEARSGIFDPYTAADPFLQADGGTTTQTSAVASRLLTRIEERAPSLLTAATQLDDIALSPNFAGDLLGIAPAKPDPGAAMPADVLHWFKRASVLSLFDVPCAALHFVEPAMDKAVAARPKGAILQRLTRRIAGYYELPQQGGHDVDETKLYRLLLEELKTALADSPLVHLNEDLKKIVPGFVDLKEVSAAFGTPPGGTVTWDVWQTEFRAFQEQLAAVSVQLESETGAEAWVLEQFRRAFLTEGRFNTAPVASALPAVGTLEEDLTRLFEGFEQDILGAFDGSEALRRDFGALVVDALAAGADLGEPDTIRAALGGADWFKRRFLGLAGPDGLLDRLIGPCFPVGFDLPTPEAKQATARHLTGAFGRRVLEMTGEAPAIAARFLPDAGPQPLPIRIPITLGSAPGALAERLDAISAAISGFGYIVRARRATEESGGPVGHASLVGLAKKAVAFDPVTGNVGEDDDWFASRAVMPTLPVLNPGRAGLYVDYAGMPLASPNRPEPGQGGAELDPVQFAQKQALESIRAYVVEDCPDAPDLPALAYGYSYGISTFWVPGSGALPATLRGDAGPFVPGKLADLVDTGLLPQDDALVPYLRRTAISQAEVSVLGGDTVPDEVQPLAQQDPRLVLECVGGGRRPLDLFRRPDGAGGLTEGTDLVRLLGVSFSGGLTVDDLWVCALREDGTETVLTDLEHDAGTGCLTVPLGELATFGAVWLRLAWAEDAAPGGCLSFDVPRLAEAPDNQERDGKVILLAKDTKDWRVGPSRDIRIAAPGVSFADFDCWSRNSALWADATGGHARGSELLEAIGLAQVFLTELGTDVLRRMLAEAGVSAVAGQDNVDLLNRLPDLAVRRLAVFAAGADEIRGQRGGAESLVAPLEIQPYDPARLEGLLDDITANMPTEDDTVDDEERKAAAQVVALYKLIAKIIAEAQRTITVTYGDKLAFGGNELKVPAGWVTRLAVHPGVEMAHLADADKGGVFHPGMRQLVVGEYDGFVLFDGPRLHLETVRAIEEADWPAHTSVRAEPQERLRAFTVEYLPDETNRIFGRAQIEVQQWQPTGRPIYRWIEPVPAKSVATHPAVQLTILPGLQPQAVAKAGQALEAEDPMTVPDKPGQVRSGVLAAFEEDAFFGFDATRGDPRKPIVIAPPPSETRLVTQDWPYRSATYFRFKVRFFSRYAALHRQTDSQVYEMRDAQSGDPWPVRVAMLADPLQGDVTRPQLRTLFPLLRRPKDDAAIGEPTLPVACVLAEPPFAQFGLADRVCADLKTINTYSTEGELHVDRLRKELGPDPRLSYFALPDDPSRQATVRVEGPVGLHFEGRESPDPALVNSQYMLHLEVPDMPDDGVLPAELEESFLGIGMTRFADPAWSFVAPPADGGGDGAAIDGFHATWIDVTGDIALQGRALGADTDSALITVRAEGGMLRVKIARAVLYAQGGDGLAKLCDLPEDARVVLLLQPRGDGRHTLSVLRRPKKIADAELEKQGRMELPQLVALVDFTVVTPLTMEGAGAARITRQSEVTFADWTRTARDMDLVRRRGGEEAADEVQSLDALVPVLGAANGLLEFRDAGGQPFAISSPVSLRRYPLHVHRRFVPILRRPSPQIGHRIDLYHAAYLADAEGRALVAPQADAQVSLMEIEMRAEILRVQDGISMLERYASGYFDLKGSRGAAPMRQVRLHLRAANVPLKLAGVTLQFTLGDKVVEGLAFDGAGAEETWALDVTLYQTSGGEQPGTRWAYRMPGGSLMDQAAEELGGIFDPTLEGFHLAVHGTAMHPETWLDVSMLHSRVDRTQGQEVEPFDFDWILGQVESGTDLTEALSAKVLNRLPEAQARVVGHSVIRPVRTDAA
ncbi:hypothetical protein [Sulfitobacter delicatus]|uniref:Uncharacterized protein n=1 Tax=Sulfitobacter delicatus TaxID=218672 RepID=A0A1G7RB30_9RHOB|nr:hypothetical protein [Sulfitobacter delicatus]SDG08016.1 hypothetical protein SAMN04489759_104332 [Sulfitobacter delicatus]